MDNPVNFITLIADDLQGTPAAEFLHTWEPLIFSLVAVAVLSTLAFFAGRKISAAPGRLQAAAEMFVGAADDFCRGIIGPLGREFTPFIGTLFIYILAMNLFGLIPLAASSTANWSVTFALALCVFIYVQYAGLAKLGLRGYCDHLLGRPRGIVAYSIVIPVLFLFIHVISELVKPISLSLRLRSNIWGDEMLLSLFSGFGIKGLPLLFFNSILAVIASVVQALVFCLLAAVYFSLVLTEDAHSV